MPQKPVIFEHAGERRQIEVPDDATDLEIAEIYDSYYPGVADEPTLPPEKPKGKSVFDYLPSGTDIARSALRGAISVPETAVGLLDIPTMGYAGKGLEKLGFQPKEAKKGLDILLPPSKQLQEQQKAFKEAPGLAAKFGTALTSPALVGTSLIESAPSMLGAGGAARTAARFLPKASRLALGALGGGAVSAGSMAENLRQESKTGTLTPGQSLASLAVGGATGGITLGLGKVANILGVADIDQVVVKAATDPKFRAGIMARLGGAGVEGTEETFQSAVETAIQNAASGKPVLEGVGESAILGGTVGALMGGGVTPGKKVAERPPSADPNELLRRVGAITPDVPLQEEARQTGPTTFDVDLRSSEQPTEMRELDPRITGEAQTPPAITPVPEFGPGATAGPLVEGAKAPPVTPGGFAEQVLGGPVNLADWTAKIEEARAAARAEIDKGLTPEQIAAANERGGRKAGVPPPGQEIAKQPEVVPGADFVLMNPSPERIRDLVENEGYIQGETTPEGGVVMKYGKPVGPKTPDLLTQVGDRFVDMEGNTVIPSAEAQAASGRMPKEIGPRPEDKFAESIDAEVLAPDEVSLAIGPRGEQDVLGEQEIKGPDEPQWSKQGGFKKDYTERKRILKKQIDAAYRAGQTKLAVSLSQDLEEIEHAERPRDYPPSRPSTPGRALGSDPYKWHLGRSYQGGDKTATLLQTNIEAKENQNKRAQALGLDPKKYKTMEELTEAIYNRRIALGLKPGEEHPDISRFKLEDALTTRGMDDPVAVAINEAKQLGLNPDDYDRLDELQWAITRRTFQELRRTGKNPLSDPTYDPTGAPPYEHSKVPPEEPQWSKEDIRDWTPEELELRKKRIRYDWAVARAKAKELKIDTRGLDRLQDLHDAIKAVDPNWMPMFKPVAGMDEPKWAMTEGGNLQTGLEVGPIIQVITNLYEGEIATIATKELVQNALDAIRPLGKDGVVKVLLNHKDNWLEVADNGPGMTLQQVATVYTDIGSTGKQAGGSDIGGYGIAKAAFQLGGEKFELTTVAVGKDGKKRMVTFTATPAELIAGQAVPTETIVPDNTPTGTEVTVTVPPGNDFYYAKRFFSNVGRYSGTDGKLMMKNIGKYSFDTDRDYKEVPNLLSKMSSPLADVDSANAVAKLSLPADVVYATRTKMEMVLLNRGMYQGSYEISILIETPNLPDRIIVDIHSKVPALDKKYPWVPSRERLKGDISSAVAKYVDDHLVDPTRKKRAAEIAKLYADLPEAPFQHQGKRKFFYYDSKGQLTPDELQALIDDPIMNELSGIYSDLVEHVITQFSSIYPWNDQFEQIGFMLVPPGYYGVHLPDPVNDKSAIGLNPIGHFIGTNGAMVDPHSAATDMVHTIIHEIAHGRRQAGGHLIPHEDADFEKTLGEIYKKMAFGRREFEDRILEAIYDPNTGTYNTGVQGLLLQYLAAVGRAGTKTDLLTGTGIKSEDSEQWSKGQIPPDSGPTGKGTPKLPKEIVVKQLDKQSAKELVKLGYEASGESTRQGDPIWRLAPENKTSFMDILQAPKGLMSVDIPFLTSAGFRQGLPLIGMNFGGWVKAWGNSVKAYGAPHAYQMVMHEISKHPYFRKRVDENGDPKPSLAVELGLAMTDLGAFTTREELVNSKLAERIKGYGMHVAASNRAYTAFLNSARAHSLIRFGNQAKSDSRSLLMLKIPGRDIETDIAFGKELADAINVLTGRGKLNLQVWGAKHEIKLEWAAKGLVRAFFSPRLQAARTKMLNPAAYIGMDPFVRKMMLKGLFGAVGTWWAIASLMEMLGADVNKDPNNADFGKGRIGNTRIDAGSGFQQFLVLFSRLRPEWFRSPVEVPFLPYGEMVEDPGGGKWTSSTSGQTEYFGEGYPPMGRDDVLQGFLENKLDPTVKFAWDLFNADKSRPFAIGDRTLQLALPIMSGDIVDVINTDSTLIPLVAIPSAIGMGTTTYEGGRPEPSIVPSDWDITIGQP